MYTCVADYLNEVGDTVKIVAKIDSYYPKRRQVWEVQLDRF